MPYIVSDLLIRCNAERIESCSYHWGAVPRHALCRCNAERIERIDLQEDVRKGAGEPLRCNSERIESQPPQKKNGPGHIRADATQKELKVCFPQQGQSSRETGDATQKELKGYCVSATKPEYGLCYNATK